MEATYNQRRSASPATTIQSTITAPSTAPSLADLPTSRFSSVKEVFDAIESLPREEDALAITGVTLQQFLDIRQRRDQLRRKIRLFHIASDNLVIITVPNRKHEKAHAIIYGEIFSSIISMGLKRSWVPMHGTTFPTNANNRSSKEGDGSGGPTPDRQAEDAWPTLVIESGVTQSMLGLRAAIRWWFSASDHAVKIVLLIKVNRHLQKITIEKWTEGPPNPRPGATATRAALAITPLLRQTIGIEMTPLARDAPPDDAIRADLNSYIVTRGDLRLEFELLFLRPPRQGEGDVVISVEDLREFARLMWYT